MTMQINDTPEMKKLRKDIEPYIDRTVGKYSIELIQNAPEEIRQKKQKLLELFEKEMEKAEKWMHDVEVVFKEPKRNNNRIS